MARPGGWNAHWHGLFLEGGFDAEGRFVHIPWPAAGRSPAGGPRIDLQKMSSCFRQRVIAFFLERKLLDERLAKSNGDGTLGAWAATSRIGVPRMSLAAVAYQGYLYVLGGAADQTRSPLASVEYAPINADGTVGAWSYKPAGRAR